MMLSDRTNNDTDEDVERETSRAVSEGSRSIPDILERSRKRRRRNSYTRAPDFVHGNRRLEVLYERFGEAWVEQTAFVERLPQNVQTDGGWTVATFEAGFLTIEHGLADELDDLDQWLEEQFEGIERAIVLSVAPESAGLPVEGIEVLPVNSSRTRLQQLETRELDLTRDRDFGNGAPFASSSRERLLESRLDVMTLICLSAKLVARSR